LTHVDKKISVKHPAAMQAQFKQPDGSMQVLKADNEQKKVIPHILGALFKLPGRPPAVRIWSVEQVEGILQQLKAPHGENDP
jgi:hypothetical protein